MFYIGLSTTMHDPGLCILNEEGEVLFAEATERHLQNKRAMNCPPDSINWIDRVLEQYGVSGPVTVATTWKYEDAPSVETINMLNMMQKMRSAFAPGGTSPHASLGDRYLSEFWRMLATANTAMQEQVASNLLYRLQEKEDFKRARPVPIKKYDHHTTHAANACYTSPYGEALCAVIDGHGDSGAAAYFHFKDGVLTELEEPVGNASLGLTYWHLCNACGFDGLRGEEWKVMGLAAYGELDQATYDLLRPCIKVQGTRMNYAADYAERMYQLLKNRRKWESPEAAANLAFTSQLFFEEVLTELLHNLHALGISDNLVLSGGCALNSAFNGRIVKTTPFRSLHVPSAPADDGNAMGAALLAWVEDHPGEWKQYGKSTSPYLGAEMSTKKAERALHFLPTNQGARCKDVFETASRMLAEGRIIGWAQGRAEFGPRALGNRSILADARFPAAKAKLNALVKFREGYRPFAPSILHEFGPEYFEDYQYSPYMERTLRFTEMGLRKAPGAVHVNGTGRLQSVTKELNPEYYTLLSRFNELTGVPLLINTSLNVMGRPIVNDVEDVLSLLMMTGIDAIFIGDYLFSKSHRRVERHKFVSDVTVGDTITRSIDLSPWGICVQWDFECPAPTTAEISFEFEGNSYQLMATFVRRETGGVAYGFADWNEALWREGWGRPKPVP